MIVERQAGDTWGKSIVQQLSGDLQKEFPGIGGFSASNLWRMKSFFEAYAGSEKLAQLVREIGWGHNLVILQRCSDHEREDLLGDHVLVTTWSSCNGVPIRWSASSTSA